MVGDLESERNRLAQPLPALRPVVELTPVVIDGQRWFCLQDRLDPEAAPLVVSEAAALLATLLDGRRTLGEVRTAFLLRTGVMLPEQELREFIERLDRAYLLDSVRCRARLVEQRKAFQNARERPAMFAGRAYPGSAEEVRDFFDRLFTAPNGPGGPPGPPRPRVAQALIAPHIDLHRGGPAYAWAYGALAECQPADVYLLLGTCHTPMRTPLAATRKAYATPLGAVQVAQDFIDLLESVYPGDLYADELSHRAEHSLEFQALALRYLAERTRGREPLVVPLLCGSLHEWSDGSGSPRAVAEIAAAVEALRTALQRYGRRVCLIAGADLAHVGPQFGDREVVSVAVRARVERRDREMLELICAADAEGFFRQVMSDGDARRICGLAPIYYLLALLDGVQGRLLAYHQWVDERGHGSVTYASVIFEQPEDVGTGEGKA